MLPPQDCLRKNALQAAAQLRDFEFSLHARAETQPSYALGISARQGIAPPTPPYSALQV